MTRKAPQPSFVGFRQAVIGALMAALTCATGAAAEQTEARRIDRARTIDSDKRARPH